MEKLLWIGLVFLSKKQKEIYVNKIVYEKMDLPFKYISP
jgi:hypothetical protein